MRKMLIAGVLLLCATGIYAQKNYTLSFLKKEIAVEGRYFYIDSLIDARPDKSSLGMAQVGPFNKDVPVLVKGELADTLKRAMNVWFPRREGQFPLCLKIKKFRINEHTASKEAGVFDLIVDVFKYNPVTHTYDSVRQYEVSSIECRMDVTDSHNRRIQEVFAAVLADFVQFEKYGSSITHKSFNTGALKKGVYADLNELRYNEPSITSGYEVVAYDYSSVKKYGVKDAVTGRSFPKVAGFCDGKNIYLSTKLYRGEDAFVQVSLLGRYIYFEDKFASYDDPAVGVMFGATGVLLYSSKKGLVLDYYTGKFYILDSFLTMRLLEIDPELQQKFKDDPGNDIGTIKLYIEALNEKH